jgi:hypothetical protein
VYEHWQKLQQFVLFWQYPERLGPAGAKAVAEATRTRKVLQPFLLRWKMCAAAAAVVVQMTAKKNALRNNVNLRTLYPETAFAWHGRTRIVVQRRGGFFMAKTASVFVAGVDRTNRKDDSTNRMHSWPSGAGRV